MKTASLGSRCGPQVNSVSVAANDVSQVAWKDELTSVSARPLQLGMAAAPLAAKKETVPVGVSELVPTDAVSVTGWLVTGSAGLEDTATSESGEEDPPTTVAVTVCTPPLSW